MNYMLVIVISQFSDYQSCNDQAAHENAYLEQAGEELKAFCMVEAPYAPITTIRPTARPQR